ncbi:hypothetical protein Rhopal_002446-T1 [Rhodotorula paludigena]|uniref:shikimate kinase n=1 Tax=Rhodotorula paludigena TaxID=86838 RepID=A0AAV5GJ03_9BASI|nr:hypothetical protein Rhopal_002446-T1 [Rhodotorula paludigena]
MELSGSFAGRWAPDASVFLIGMRGVGKTTIGLMLSGVLSRPFLDADRIFESAVGVPLKQFVDEHGFSAFRDRETLLLQQLVREHARGKVIALGGGVVEREENRRIIEQYAASRGPVIRILRDPNAVLAFLSAPAKDKSTWTDLQESYAAVWQRRIPWYESCSNLAFVAPSPDSSAHPSLALKAAEDAIKRFAERLVGVPSPRSLRALAATRRTTALVLPLSLVDELDRPRLEAATRGVDAIEIHIAQTLDISTARFDFGTHIALLVGRLRTMTRLPLLYRPSRQAYSAHDASTYFQLIKLGFELACEVVDVSLNLQDEELATLLEKRSPASQIMLSSTLDPSQSWGDDGARAVYARAARLGANVIRLEKAVASVDENLELRRWQTEIAASDGPPLIGLGHGDTARLSLLLNSLLTPVRLPGAAENNVDKVVLFTADELRHTSRLAGLDHPRCVHLVGTTAAATTLGQRLLDAGFRVDITQTPPLLTDVFSHPDSRAVVHLALIPQPSSGPPVPKLSLLARNATRHDVVLCLRRSSAALSSRPQEAGVYVAENTLALAVSHLVVKHLSPVNAISTRSTAILLGVPTLSAGIVPELLAAVHHLGIRRIAAVGCSSDALERLRNFEVLRTVVVTASLDEAVPALRDEFGAGSPTVIISCDADPPDLPPVLAHAVAPGIVVHLPEARLPSSGARQVENQPRTIDGWLYVGSVELSREREDRLYEVVTGYPV